jgi:periplasmic divalent cation tolerance protein
VTDARVVLTTAGREDEAQRIAHALVERQLAACVNVVPKIGSVYRWQGKIEIAEEWLLLIKTTAANFPAVRDAINELHSYDLPECICLTVDGGSDGYLQWIASSTRAPERR